MKRLAIITGLAVAAGLAASCGVGFAASRGIGSGAVSALRDFGIIILAILYLIVVAILGGFAFAAAWAVGRFGSKALTGLRWVSAKLVPVERGVDSGSERFVIRPLASASRRLSTGRALLARLTGGRAGIV